ncbi:MAG: hypothetical protein FWG56_07925 [Desulfovibrionaceae bacterium]|nr:hypothetical protein [Desulfovibrionaceae bacterium]
MPSVQRFLSGRDNLARQAALSASSVRAASAIERVAAQRAGGGRARLAGDYTGHEDAAIEVRVVSEDGIPRASVPQFTGVGNGQLQALAVGGLAPLQGLTLTLADLGVRTAHALLDVREVQLRARAAGSAGNSIRISVQPQLILAPTAWALLSAWPAGTAVQTGPQWDFGGLPLNDAQQLDPASPRIVFGNDPQVYRPWRRFKDGAWQFGVSPALERNAPAGAPVLGVTGGYVVTVTDGVSTETFGDAGAGQDEIITFYDLLAALAGSALIEVAGVVVADRTAGGQAAIDVPLRTQSWLLALSGVSLADVAAPPAAPTQTVTVRCINADLVGAERWSVFGDVSGALPVATTGIAYASDAALFTVPAIDPAALGSGRWSFKYQPASRPETMGVPSVCLRPFRLGINAAPLTVTFRYQRRPPPDCQCTDMPTPLVSMRCLGLEPEDDMAIDAAYQTRLEALYQWRAQFMAANTQPGISAQAIRPDMDFADLAAAALAQGLAEIHEQAPALAEWDAALADMQDDLAWLMGINNSLGVNGGSSSQGGNPGWVFVNPVNKLSFLLVSVDGVGIGQEPPPSVVMLDGDPGWTDPADPVWDASGEPFTLTVTVLDGSQRQLVYRCLPDMRFADLAGQYDAESASTGLRALITQLQRRYTARMDYCRTLAGIVPKIDSSSSDAGGCWIDHGGDYWWADVDGYYLPAFTNEAYISSRRDTETGRPYTTMEFGFGLVVACPDRLMEGDTITVRIEQVDGERPYRVGDQAIIQTIGAGPAWLAGGVDGTDVQTWRVAASASGALPDYVVPTGGSPIPTYSAAGIDLLLAPGGIPFVLGDAFTLAVEAGQYQWRRDGGPWSATLDIPADGAADLEDGLAVQFDSGAAPSFVPGDAFSFIAHQPWAASHVRDARAATWGWAGDGASMTLDFGGMQPIGAVALARYQLPEGATVAFELSVDGLAWSAPQPLDISRPVAVQFIAAPARYLRLNIANAPGGAIGWLWAGQPMQTRHHASACRRNRRWAIKRGEGINPASLYAGAGDGWSIGWQPGDAQSSALLAADVEQLLSLLDWAQTRDEPLLFAPHAQHPQDAALVRFAADALEVTDEHAWQPNAAGDRILSASLELEPVFA